MNIETKFHSGQIKETKEIQRDGLTIGVIAGYIATWDIDRGDDQFVKGCFSESINEHLAKNRQVRFKAYHDDIIGGFPIATVMEDEIGLYGIGELNLEIEDAKEVYALAKQGVLTEFSIGYSVLESEIKEGIRIITKAKLWEGSIVDEPMNPAARITEIKSDKFTVEQVKEWTVRELEDNLSSIMSNNAAKMLAGKLKTEQTDKKELVYNEILAALKQIKI